jgi:ubiquinone/menaquinone biosynthesis C-methylase UbiE
MSQMFDIYNNQNNLYDELVSHEDHQQNLTHFLRTEIPWESRAVIEFGVGTGRVTRMYIDLAKSALLYDNSSHMLEGARENLKPWKEKTSFQLLDNRGLNQVLESAHVVIQGWSFGHLIVDNPNTIDHWINHLVGETTRIAKEAVVFIETMGTNVTKPLAPTETLAHFYKSLKESGFAEYVLETDYLFEDYTQAARIMGSFFGEKMEADIVAHKKNLIPEFTGVWVYTD